NFERYVYDMVGRDPARLRELWHQLDAKGEFDLSHSAFFKHVVQSGFVSDFSTHADRLATIRRVFKVNGVMVDTHTADGIKVAAGFREPGVPMVCLETALPAKFAETIEEALGRAPDRPAGYENIESLPQRVEVMAPDVAAVKAYVAGHSV
ncbi:MAG: threonine synthase, partial [Proteobacteria bacterium]|nr:threonine synthase [Pseudomonadota bacterium]